MKTFRTAGLVLWVAAGLAALLLFVWRLWLGFNMTFMLEYPDWKTPDQPRHDVSSRIDLDAPDLTHVLLHDGPRGWFLVTQPEVLREVKIATPPSWLIRAQNPLGPFLKGCGWPKFKALLPVHGDQIMGGLKFCNPGLMDLEALVALARPVSMNISQLTGAEIDILAGDIANDPRAFWLSRPAALPRLTHERTIRLAILWPETPDRWRVDITDAVWDHLEQNGISRDDVDIHLSDGAFQAVSEAGRDRDQTSISGTPFQGPDGPVLVPDTLRFFQPTLTVSCTPTACAALEGVDLSPPLARMRDPATLSAHLKDAPWFSPTHLPTLTPEAIAQDGLQIEPVQERRHLTRHVTLK